MKKKCCKGLISLVVMITIMLSVLVLPVKAGNATYIWFVNEIGEHGDKTQVAALKDSTIFVQRILSIDEYDKGQILTLNNYNGKGLSFECRGTGVSLKDNSYIINLIGDNVINDDEVGIAFESDAKLTFVGDGTLTINAKKPLSYADYKDNLVIKPSVNYSDGSKEASDKVEEKEKNEKMDTVKTKDKDEKNINYVYIGFGAYALISLVIIICLIIKSKKNKKINN